ncbi:alpha-L-rhamnosidase [Occallatibacter riparius]|uniref:alpha-L-rhamnosidase n=1 Tax=Occallatibacter riparius TaxID=1002689 RepID=A0A9J7BNQ8_9BACT|nr:alpha-L-rhamnosidase [Occallatibacter riparius]UWZ83386.1 glycoside hydrolase family 78 protein [Occallatibacter riparius]
MNLRSLSGIVRSLLSAAIVVGTLHSATLLCAATVTGPVDLRVDNLTTPLGIDDPTPSFSWRLDDAAPGAKQTAYQLTVFAKPATVPGDNVLAYWTTGRVESSQSMNIRYAGPALQPSARYYWSVTVYGIGGKAYPAAKTSWWETGLMTQDAWKADWIGYETAEEAAVRHASAKWIASPEAESLISEEKPPAEFQYRASIRIDKPVKSATLYATAQDTVAAWINGTQVIEASPFPAWHQMPWKKFVRADITGKLAQGDNILALESVVYVVRRNGKDAPPLIATIFVQYADGTTATFASSQAWKTSTHAADGWQQKSFDDSSWKSAVEFTQSRGDEAPLGNPWIPDSVKALRSDFNLSKPVKSARLYSTALGDYEMFLNGKRVGEDYFAPGWTDYRERVVYQTHDVTSLLAQGNNAIGALLAPGWYSTPLEWFQQPNNYGVTPPALRAQLRIEYGDGSVEWVATNRDWHAASSYIDHSELYDGESQDGRKTRLWSFKEVEMVKWPSVEVIEPKSIDILAQDYQPIRVEREMHAKAVSSPSPGVYIYDFGQNLAGIEKLRVSGPRGTDVKVRFAEILNDDGTMYTENLRTAKATDHFILAGTGVEEFTPQFTFHGFRYAEITGLKSNPGKDALTVLVLHTDAPFAAQLKTGNDMINKLWSNIVWGQRSNFVGIPTDCPQRDERLGWMADAQVFWRTASYNMDLAAFSRKFSRDMRGTQFNTAMYGIYAPGTGQENTGFGPGWSDAGVIIPWTAWLQTGDTSIIDQNWDAMTKYVAAIEDANSDGLWKNKGGTPFGDWLAPEGRTNQVLIATASWAYDAALLREMAHASGRTADEQKYAAMFDKIRAAFQKQFVHDDGFVAGADKGPNPMGERTHDTAAGIGDTQTGYVLALHMNLLPDNLRAAAAQKLVDKIQANNGLLGTGFLGTPYLLEELTKTGHADVAYQLLMNTKYPSWGYLIEHGATTTWERWNGDEMKKDPSMNSYNHYAYGAVADWIYRYAAGVDASSLDAGFHTIMLHPQFDKRLGSVDFTYPSSYGTIHSAWTVQGTKATWKITIPANTTGFISNAEKGSITSTRKYDGFMESAAGPNGEPGTRLQPGTYEFTAEVK